MSAERLTCDVAVVGGGPAGIAAATRAAEHGRRVVLVDLGVRLGGQIWRHRDPATLSQPARRWIARFARSGTEWLAGATVVDGSAAEGLRVARGAHAMTVDARAVVVATGARERFLPFPGWTLPGVMGVGGAQALLKGGLHVRGRRVVVSGSGPLLLPLAAAMARAGARVMAVCEQAPLGRLAAFGALLARHPTKLLQGAAARAALGMRPVRTGWWVARADGSARVERVTLTDGSRRSDVPCDLLCCSYGFVPNTELAQLLGCIVHDGVVAVDALQRTQAGEGAVFCAGEPTGISGEGAAIAEGEIAGLAAVGNERAALAPALQRARDRWRRFGARLDGAFALRAELRDLADPDTIVCRCEDVPLGALDPAWTVRQAKLYTRLGMGPCQGAVCGPACTVLFGWPAGRVRPPLGAARVGALCAPSAQGSGGRIQDSG